MHKVVNGKHYNSDAAKKIGFWNCDNGEPTVAFSEVLCRKRTGEYFLYCKGGPASRYGVYSKGTGWRSGEKILPINKEQAVAWAKEHLSKELYQKEFEVAICSGDSKQLTLLLPVSTIEMLRSLAHELGYSGMSGLIDELVRREYREKEAAEELLREVSFSHAEIQGNQLLAEYEEAKRSGKLGEIPASLDARCRALIEAAGGARNE